jgi:hypothetical protein
VSQEPRTKNREIGRVKAEENTGTEDHLPIEKLAGHAQLRPPAGVATEVEEGQKTLVDDRRRKWRGVGVIFLPFLAVRFLD